VAEAVRLRATIGFSAGTGRECGCHAATKNAVVSGAPVLEMQDIIKSIVTGVGVLLVL
jgi:hypothetical protein